MTRKGDTDHYKGVIIRGAAPYLLSLSSVCWQRDKRSPVDKGEDGNHRSWTLFFCYLRRRCYPHQILLSFISPLSLSSLVCSFVCLIVCLLSSASLLSS